MQLVKALASGVKGAESGTARFRKRGTGITATWYATFEGTNPSSNDVSLDGNGGATVYVNELVDVSVFDKSGNTIRTFVEGEASPNIEVMSQSFTGADYETAVAGVSEPLTLQQVLDLWIESAGAPDFKVLFGGSVALLKNALAGAQFYNVKDSVYGAKGDGATDDAVAVQAAINAAHAAGGGWVLFPGGTYRFTTTVTWYSDVNLIGVSRASRVAMDHASNDLFTVSGATVGQIAMGLWFSELQACSGKKVVDAGGGELLFIDCTFGSGTNSTGTQLSLTGSTIARCTACKFFCIGPAVVGVQLYLSQCVFQFGTLSGGSLSFVKASANLLLSDSKFLLTTATASTITAVEFAGANGTVSGCEFGSFGATTTGICINQSSAGDVAVHGCRFGAKGSATSLTAMKIATGAPFAESGNTFASAVAVVMDTIPYSYTASVAGGFQLLGSRDSLRGPVATQSGGGTKTLDTDLYGNIQLTISDNTGFTLDLALAPIGSVASVALYSSGGAGTGAIAWGTNIYGSPTGGFTIATTKARLYTFRSELIQSTLGWVIVGNIDYGGDL